MFALLLIVMDSPAPADLPGSWAQFSRSGALSHVSERVEIVTAPNREGSQLRYILRRTVRSLDAAPAVTWADSATCPAIRAALVTMRDIHMPSPAPYGVGDDLLEITLDGTAYALTAPSSDNMGRLTLSSNVGSPLARWVDATFQQLSPCWRQTAP